MIGRALLIGSVALSVMFPSQLRSEGLLLTEFMVDNSTTLQDDDGDYSDWVEVFNSGDAEVNLEGYCLSDDPNAPTKWRFPAGTTLGARQTLVVFCSGKNLKDPALPLHTNFKLAEALGVLLLLAPDGKTVLSSYVGYPEQQTDVSYGMATDSNSSSSIVDGAPVRVLVPPGPDLGLQWTQLDFDDGSWKEGTTGVGYGGPSPALTPLGTDVKAEMQNVNSSIYIRI